MCVRLVKTWYECNSAFQHSEVHKAFLLLFIMRVNYINNKTHDFLGAQENYMSCKNLNDFVNSA